MRRGQYVTTTIVGSTARPEKVLGAWDSRVNREPGPGRKVTAELRTAPALRVMSYGTEFEQEIDTADAASVASSFPVADVVTAARQEAWTVAETLKEALAVAAAR
jgi:hypothetical protein